MRLSAASPIERTNAVAPPVAPERTALRMLAKAEAMGVVLAAGDDLAIVSRSRDLAHWEQRWIHQHRGSIWVELHVRTLITAALEEAKR